MIPSVSRLTLFLLEKNQEKSHMNADGSYLFKDSKENFHCLEDLVCLVETYGHVEMH